MWRSQTLDCVKKVNTSVRPDGLVLVSMLHLFLSTLLNTFFCFVFCFRVFRNGFWGPDQHILWDSRVFGPRSPDRYIVHPSRRLVGTGGPYLWDACGRGENDSARSNTAESRWSHLAARPTFIPIVSADFCDGNKWIVWRVCRHFINAFHFFPYPFS